VILISIYIHDDRYQALTWRTVEINAKEATAFARYLIASSPHYRKVELRVDDTLIAVASKDELIAHAA
jgi:hypothetical protein